MRKKRRVTYEEKQRKLDYHRMPQVPLKLSKEDIRDFRQSLKYIDLEQLKDLDLNK